MIHFYRRYLRNTAQVLGPLTKGPGKSLLCSPQLNSALVLAKQLFASVPVLTHPKPGAPASLGVDASDSHIGAVLQQKL